jgi:hypothetical protein
VDQPREGVPQREMVLVWISLLPSCWALSDACAWRRQYRSAACYRRAGRALGAVENCDAEQMWCTSSPSGFRYFDDEVGDGTVPVPGDVVMLEFSGSILSDGRRVTFSNGARSPLRIVIGKSMRRGGIPWDEATEGMSVGGRRRVLVPPTSIFVPEPSETGGEIADGETSSEPTRMHPCQLELQ